MKKNSKNKRDRKERRITVRMTADDKLLVRNYARMTGMSYAAVVREALHTKFPEGFDPKNE